MALKVRIFQSWPTDLGQAHSNYWLTVDAEAPTDNNDYVSVSISESSANYLIKQHKLVADSEKISEIAMPGSTFKIYKAS